MCVFFCVPSFATDRGIRRRQWRGGRQSRGATLCCLGSCSSPLAHSGDPRDKNKTQKRPRHVSKNGQVYVFCLVFFFPTSKPVKMMTLWHMKAHLLMKQSSDDGTEARTGWSSEQKGQIKPQTIKQKKHNIFCSFCIIHCQTKPLNSYGETNSGNQLCQMTETRMHTVNFISLPNIFFPSFFMLSAALDMAVPHGLVTY